jgi:hypothetical protein
MAADPAPITLGYGRQAPAWRRRRIIVPIVIVAAVLVAGWMTWSRVAAWYELWSYRREAARWYAAACNWSEPPRKLKYTENPADAQGGKFVHSYRVSGSNVTTGSESYGGSPVERLPLFTGDGKPILAAAPDEAMLFMHLRTNAHGLTRLIAVEKPVFDGKILRFPFNEIGLLKDDYRILRGGTVELDMTGIAAPGEIRIFAGQPDPKDASRFSIPFEARGRRGYFDGVFTVGPHFSKDPASAKVEEEMNSVVELTMQMAPTSTQPASAPATQAAN